jgi:hypothetical protein
MAYRQRRIEFALDVYHMAHGVYPANAALLAEAGLVEPEELAQFDYRVRRDRKAFILTPNPPH